MAVRVADAALVGVDRHEAPGQAEDVGDLRVQPVHVRGVLAAAVVVLADAEEVEFGGVEGVPVRLHQRAVVQTVVRELRVAMGVAAVDLVGAALGLDRVGADAGHVLGLVGMDRVGVVLAHLRVDQPRRRGLAGQGRQLRRVDLGVVEQVLLGVPVVRRPGREQVAPAVRGQLPAHVLATAAERQVERPRPLAADVGGAVELPRGAVGRREVRRVAGPDRAVTEEQPHPAVGVGLQHGQVVEPRDVLGEFAFKQLVHVGRGDLPADAVPYRHREGAPLVDAGRLLVDLEARVLAPLEAALVPGRPQPVLAVAGDRRVGLELRRLGYRGHVAPGTAGKAAQQYVVVALVVGVPGDVDRAVTAGRDSRRPVVGGRGRDGLRGRPARAVVAPGEDVGAAVTEALPHEPQVAVRVRGELVLDVRLGRGGQALGCRPVAGVRVLEIAAVEIEVGVDLLGPDQPGPTLAVAAQFRHQPVARLFVHRDGRLPSRAVEAPRHHGDAAVPVGGPGGPHLAVVAAHQRREVGLMVRR